VTLAPCAPCYASQYLLFGLDTGSVRGSALPLPLPLSISTSADSCRIKTISISLHSRDQRASHSSKCTENLTEKPGRRGKKCLIMYEDQLGADPPEVNEMSGYCTAFALGRSADNSRIIWRRTWPGLERVNSKFSFSNTRSAGGNQTGADHGDLPAGPANHIWRLTKPSISLRYFRQSWYPYAVCE